MYDLGTKVIVTTCSGEYRGKITGYSPWDFNYINDAYNVSGPKIITKTKKVILDTGQVLKKGSTCPTCDSKKDCCFSSWIE